VSLSILSLDAIVQRLTSQNVGFNQIEGAAEMENAIRSGIRITPAGFVIALKEDAGRNSSASMVVTQQITDLFAVVYGIKNVNGAHGSNAIDGGLRDLRLATMKALVGWVPSTGFNTCEFDGGSLIRVDAGTVLWRDRFRTNHINEI
jgi:hypothetical protein